MRVGILVLFLGIFLSTTLQAESLHTRAARAKSRCNLSSLAEPNFTAPDEYMKKHFRPSNTQRVLTPIFTGIFDHFGGVIQGLISREDEFKVRGVLKDLGKAINSKSKLTPMTKANKICMANCMVNYLMETDDVIPTMSMMLAVSRGKGFCRHFSMATEIILEAAGVNADTETSFTHMFIKTKINGKLHYADPTNENGRWECNLFPADSVY